MHHLASNLLADASVFASILASHFLADDKQNNYALIKFAQFISVFYWLILPPSPSHFLNLSPPFSPLQCI